MKTNENYTDRLLRLFLSIIFFIIGYFWLGGIFEIIFITISLILFLTSVTGFCPLYLIVKFDTTKHKNFSKKINILLLIIILLIGGALIYASIFFTTKSFIEDFNDVNNSYKQLLFNTGKEKREESIKYYEELNPKLQTFENKYVNYKPYKLKLDNNFDLDLQKIDFIIKDLKNGVYTGSLAETHKQLEGVRTILQDILKRNGFSLVGIALVDFHDVMEILIEASDEKDKEKLISTYDQASEKLQIVEGYLNNQGVQDIRTQLDKLLELANNDKLDDLSKQAGELKSSFIKVYLSNN
nr:DUF2892 domain-containing protein [Candidatus Gracilibacteria bacterium]